MNRRVNTRPAGFSLIELMVTLVMIAVLAAIALPSYGQYAARARRVTARSSLVQLAHWLERVATSTGRYPQDIDIPAGLLRSEGDHYRLRARTGDSTFTLEAIPLGVQAGDRCGTLTLLQSGERNISNATPDTTVDACWNR